MSDMATWPFARTVDEGGDIPDGYRVESYMRPGTVCIAWRVMMTGRNAPVSAGFTMHDAAIESAVYHAGRSADIAALEDPQGARINPVTLHTIAVHMRRLADGDATELDHLEAGAIADELEASLEGHTIDDVLEQLAGDDIDFGAAISEPAANPEADHDRFARLVTERDDALLRRGEAVIRAERAVGEATSLRVQLADLRTSLCNMITSIDEDIPF